MPLPRFQPGQPAAKALSAKTLNTLARGVERSAGRAVVPDESAAGVLLAMVRNVGEEDLSVYQPIGLSSCFNEITAGTGGKSIPEIVYDSQPPTTSAPWGITQEAIAVGGWGKVLLAGPTWAWFQGRTVGQSHGTFDAGNPWCRGASSGRLWLANPGEATTTSRLLAGYLLPPAPTTPCANLFYVEPVVGEITGTFDWILIDNTDSGATVASGTYTLGTTTTASLKTAIEAATGVVSVNSVTGGILPANDLTIRPNEGLEFTKYTFQIVDWDLTPQGDGEYALVRVRDCCMIGG